MNIISRHKRIFIDGEAGTTGLGLRQRLAERSDMKLLAIDADKRKDPEAKRALLHEADVVILCLPDDAARATVALVDDLAGQGPRVLDASTAHRTAAGWVYGFPELDSAQPQLIADAARVANPGCYATGAIALIHPLVAAGLIAPDMPLALNAVSGYSGGGKSMIAAYESGHAPAFELYGLNFRHKHLPEITRHAGLRQTPVMIPSVGNFAQGMLVSLPLHLDALPGRPGAVALHEALQRHYAGAHYVKVMAPGLNPERLEPQALNDSNMMELFVFSPAEGREALLVARLDNLGKGASGAAVQNLDLMLGGPR
ncbi:MAG: N-acetyl-gamma-glutamyl-phosphate reductase [Hyphomicrobiales bacterium]|nr:N-acetyl-gamma-glutamyl-phosphate reductase [Hyphomicrobiales bacterium]